MDISLGQGAESHNRLGSQPSFDGKLKGNPIDRMAPHWLLRRFASRFLMRPASSSPVPMVSCTSCGKLIEKPFNCCWDPSKSMFSEALVKSPVAKFKRMEGVSTARLVGPDTSSEEINVKPLGSSPSERGSGEGLEIIWLMGL